MEKVETAQNSNKIWAAVEPQKYWKSARENCC